MRIKRNGFGAGFPTVILGVWVVGVCISLSVSLWVVPSIITSGIKAVSEKCGSTYPVEMIWHGDLFCGTPIVPKDK